MDSESGLQNQSSIEPRSESKISAGQRRVVLDAEKTSDSSKKRMKLDDLEKLELSKAQEKIDKSIVGESDKVCKAAKESKIKGINLDLNAEDISSSINDPFHPHINIGHLKSRDDSECASSVGSLDDRDSMKIWEGLKQNNYMSSPYGLMRNAIPKPRGKKKSNNDTAKKIELAKKEQIDRFAKVAAPSGLLNSLNPGIINHVRNRKQVHSIIEAIVKSKRTENQPSGSTSGEGLDDMHYLGMNYGNVVLSAKSNYLKPDRVGDPRALGKMPSQYETFAVKLSPSVMVASDNMSCLSNEESGSITNVDSLSVKAANVAFQWLELLNQDIKGRLAALKRSKRRVRAVITKELPVLLSSEFSSNGEYDLEGSTHSHFDKALVDAHATRWNTLFGEMDRALSEEEIHLESWLHQVSEMHSHCERGLCKNNFPETLPIESPNRLGEARSQDDNLAVRAAAASIYSTCNYLLSMENQPSIC